MTASTGTRILLVEDNPTDAEFVSRLLVEHGRDLDAPADGHGVAIRSIDHVDCLADALDRVKAEEYDVLLLDLELPDSQGLDTVSAVVEQSPTTPVIVLTGQSGVGVEAIRRGAQDYLVKGRISADVLVRTITYARERARITRELRDRNHRLALVNEILRTDLRNDMTMVIGRADQLGAQATPADSATVDAILDASHHALELTDTAAELMDVLSENHPVETTPTELRSVLTTELDRCRRETDVDLAVDWEAPEDEPLSVAATPMLGSVFQHLLTNATTHTDRERPTVTVNVESTGDQVSIAIADDGVGIPDPLKRRIADPATQVVDRNGVSVGLYFVTTVLESIGGELSIEDNQPRGTVVTVTLDRAGG